MKMAIANLNNEPLTKVYVDSANDIREAKKLFSKTMKQMSFTF